MKNLDEIRRELIAAGIPSEHAAQAVGAMADYGMSAYRQGFSRGFNEGADWQIERNTRRKRIANRAKG